MKKFFTSALIIGSFGLYSFFYHQSTTPVDALPVVTTTNNQTTSDTQLTQPSTINQSSDSTTTLLNTPNTPKTSAYKDGTYTGPTVDAYYGNIQVQAIIQNGKLADVKFLQYPIDQHESREINTMAIPRLRSEAISAQSADVVIVSRATDSSIAFRQSLAQALQQAKS